MNIHKALAVSAIAVVLAMPGFASATSLWSHAVGEAGATFQPDHITSTKTRADVLQELEAARKDGSLWFLQRGYQFPFKNIGSGRTRGEVRKAVLNQTLEERQRLQMIGGS